MNQIEMTPVSSSNIAGIGYRKEDSTIAVEFNNGTTYYYYDAPEHEFRSFEASESKGKYFAKNIKNVYRCERVA